MSFAQSFLQAMDRVLKQGYFDGHDGRVTINDGVEFVSDVVIGPPVADPIELMNRAEYDLSEVERELEQPGSSPNFYNTAAINLLRMQEEHTPGGSVCVDPECTLSGNFEHIGPCEPCSCGLRHAIAECPQEFR